MEPFKQGINADTVFRAGQQLQRACPAFDRTRFEALACHGLDAPDLKSRVLQRGEALRATLPPGFNAACDVLEASLAPPLPLPLNAHGEPVAHPDADAATGLTGWVIWSMGESVARHGQRDVPRALACLHTLTQRSTAEFAIRPFIPQQPEKVWPVLLRRARDPGTHVRRRVSEGSRPRLPWALRLPALVADPAPTLPLLRALDKRHSLKPVTARTLHPGLHRIELRVDGLALAEATCDRGLGITALDRPAHQKAHPDDLRLV